MTTGYEAEPDKVDILQSDLFTEDELAGGVVGVEGMLSQPPRDVERLSQVLHNTPAGETLLVTIGGEEVYVVREAEVKARKGTKGQRPDLPAWDFILEMAITVDGDTRLYVTGTGADDKPPWTVYSYDYQPAVDMRDDASKAYHGWILDVDR